MKLFARRVPVSIVMLTLGLTGAASAIYALATGDAFMPAWRGSPAKHTYRAIDSHGYFDLLRFDVLVACIGLGLAFVRILPIENQWRRFTGWTRAAVRSNGYDSRPAPKWAYGFLTLFVAFIIWIGWKVMYSP